MSWRGSQISTTLLLSRGNWSIYQNQPEPKKLATTQSEFDQIYIEIWTRCGSQRIKWGHSAWFLVSGNVYSIWYIWRGIWVSHDWSNPRRYIDSIIIEAVVVARTAFVAMTLVDIVFLPSRGRRSTGLLLNKGYIEFLNISHAQRISSPYFLSL